MNKFSKKSKRNLSSCHPDLQRLFRVVLEIMDCKVTGGHRTKEIQEQYFDSGLSEVDWPNSKHNSTPSMGIDVAPCPIDWNDTERFYYFAGIVKGVSEIMEIPIRWGGDWDGDGDLHDQTFMDLVHFELIG